MLRAGAQQLHWPNALLLGTHSWRRGWAQDCFDRGGIAAVFAGGGWRGMAAWGYLQSQQLGTMDDVDFWAHHGDSDGESEDEFFDSMSTASTADTM